MAHTEIDNMLDQLTKIKSSDDLNVVKIYQIETLEMELRFFTTFVKYHNVHLPDSSVKITKKTQLIEKMLHSIFGGYRDECKINLNVERLVSQLQECTEDKASSSYLSEYMDYLDKNLNDLPRYLVRSDPSLMGNHFLKQVKIIQKKMRFLRYLYATEIYGYVDHGKLKGLGTQIEVMADNVRQFCLAVWDTFEDDADLEGDGDDAYLDEVKFETETEEDTNSEEVEDDSSEDDFPNRYDTEGIFLKRSRRDDILIMPPYLLCLMMLVQLEMQRIFLGDLKASKFSQSRTFKTHRLPKGFSRRLHGLLMHLRNKNLENSLNKVSAGNIGVAIEFLLIFLADVPNGVINGKRLNEVLKMIGTLVSDITCAIQKSLSSSEIGDDTSETNLGSIQILEKIENLKEQVEGRYYKSLKFIPSQFSTIGGLGFLDSLSKKLNEMLKSESGLDFIMKPHIDILGKELSSLTSIFRDVAKVQHEHEVLKDLQSRTINLAYEVEVAIDSILAPCNALWHLFCSLPTIIKEIKHISAEVTEIRLENLALRPYSVVEQSIYLPTHSNLVDDEEIVGFESDMEKIIQFLTQGTCELDVIPVIGMGGQGKTAMVRKIYNSIRMVSHFDDLAWCFVSQRYNRIELLREIFNQISKDKVDKDDDLDDMLRKRLMGRRYLIVLDDMWDVEAWDSLRFSFPNNDNGSRIIVTSRLEEVGKQVRHHTDPYSLPFLTPDESCKLLQKKVFQKEGCPPELKGVSLAVAKRCKGLPLVVVLIAGVIKTKKLEGSWWNEVKGALFSYVGEFEAYSLLAMQLSYENLPDHLRPCLLYMGMFPEDTIIPVSKLISLWIAEGFVQNTESGRLEETAEGYLRDLISCSVVMVSRRRYDGKVKYCQLHDVVLHFCLEKSKEEKFMLAVKGHCSQFRPSYWKENRLSYYTEDDELLDSKIRKPFHQHLRSLITTNQREISDWNLFLPAIKFRLIKVLDLSSHKVSALSFATFHHLLHLKYIAVSADKIDFHPESYLPHLETIIKKPLSHDYTVLLPLFLKMKALRHVEIDGALFELREHKQRIFEESTLLENLRILRGIAFRVDDADSMDAVLQRCPILQELELFIIRVNHHVKICPRLKSLTDLEVLTLGFVGYKIVVPELSLPSNLKKLVLRGPHIVNVASLIAELPSLEYLLLGDWDYESEEWCLGDTAFPKLKILKLVALGISRWDVSEEAFPLLEILVMKYCDELEEIPPSFADIVSLKQIKVLQCDKESLGASAEAIRKEVKDMEGNDRLNVIIKQRQY